MHPRIALLVQTISKAIDDLFHFLLLFVIIYLTFCLIGVTTFGQKLQDYSSYGRCFGRLMDLMIDKPDFPTDYVDNGPIFLVRGGGPCEHRIPCDLSGSRTYVRSPPPPVMRSLCVPACLLCIGPSSYPLRFARSDVSSIALLRLCSLTQWLPWSGVPQRRYITGAASPAPMQMRLRVPILWLSQIYVAIWFAVASWYVRRA